MKFLIRADGNKEIGMGHIKRQADLASALSQQGHQVVFLFRSNPPSEEFLKRLDIPVKYTRIPDNHEKEKRFLKNTVDQGTFDVSIIDVLGRESDEEYLRFFQNIGEEVVVFTDNPDYKPIKADIVFNPSIEQLKYNYNNLRADYYLGPDYFIAAPEFIGARDDYDLRPNVENLMIMIGGGDTKDTPRTLLDLLSSVRYWQEVEIVLSPAYENRDELEGVAESLERNVYVHQYVPSVDELMKNNDVLLCSAGNTVYEACIVGIPVITINQVKWQNSHAEILEEKGAVLNLGLADNIKNSQLADSIECLNSYENRKAMHTSQKELFKGNGLQNVLEVLTP